ncbi:dendritic cell-specific transmembrane protein isoform X2 [Colossoma macropomum]|nr:dendritic cell-specific transmembrane protein isoform X2 [Colossoma macropomum]XP_036414525.1 dendritic cell-specific transmembrane protein isoform X2 [Colossoma macropomum]
METNPNKLKATLSKTSSRICGVYTAKSKTSRTEKLILVISCLITSLILAVLLFLALLFPLKCGFGASIATTGAFWLCITIAMCLSQRVRCFGTLFLMSIGLKQGRNLLITTGTTVVIFLNIQNILKNLTGLAKGLLCTVGEKLVAINLPPLKNYIQMLKWVARQLKKGLPEYLTLGNYYTNHSFIPTVHSQNFTNKLAEAERALNETAESVLTVIDTVSSTGKKVSPVLGVLVLVILTALYLRRFRSDPKHNNIFITRNFIKYDEKQRLQGKPSVLPLSKKEAKRYVMVPSAGFTKKEAKAMLKFSIPIVTHSLAWLFFVGVDALLYWIIITLRKRLEELEPLHVPVALEMEKGAFFVGTVIEGNKKVENFSYDVPVFEKKCLPQPELWLYESLTPLSAILGSLVFLVLVSSKMDQLRLLVSEQFFSDHAEERIEELHKKILNKRSQWKVQTAETTLKSFATQLRFWFPIFFRHEQENLEKIM